MAVGTERRLGLAGSHQPDLGAGGRPRARERSAVISAPAAALISIMLFLKPLSSLGLSGGSSGKSKSKGKGLKNKAKQKMGMGGKSGGNSSGGLMGAVPGMGGSQREEPPLRHQAGRVQQVGDDPFTPTATTMDDQAPDLDNVGVFDVSGDDDMIRSFQELDQRKVTGDFDLEGITAYQYRNEFNKAEQLAIMSQLVEEDGLDGLDEAVGAHGDPTIMDHLRAGGKAGTIKGLTKGAKAAAPLAMVAAGVATGPAGMGMAGVAAAAAAGGAAGFGKGVAKDWVMNNKVPKDFRTLEGIRKESTKMVSNRADAAGEWIDDHKPGWLGGSEKRRDRTSYESTGGTDAADVGDASGDASSDHADHFETEKE